MKVIFVAPRFHTNQIAAVQTLQSAGHDIEFHVNRVGATEDHTQLEPVVFTNGFLSKCFIKIFGQGGGDCKWHAPRFLTYYRALRASAADVVVIRNPTRLFSLFASISARLQGRRILFYTQTPLYTKWSKSKQLIALGLMKLFNATWMTPLLGNPESGTKLVGMHYVPFPVESNSALCSRVLQAQKGPLSFLMVAKYNERKNARLLIEAFSELDRDFKLTIIGECTSEAQIQLKEELERMVLSSALASKVCLKKGVPFKQMPRIYREHDVFVLPARNEPASISVLEAISTGMPAICSDTCGTSCYVKPGRTGFIFSSDSKESLKSALNDVFEMFTRETKETIAKGCINSAIQEFSGQTYLNAFLASIEKS